MNASRRITSKIFLLLLLLLLHHSAAGAPSSPVPYRIGVAATDHVTETTGSAAGRKINKSSKTIRSNIDRLWTKYARAFRIAVFLYYSRGAVESIAGDSWEGVRDPDRVFGERSQGGSTTTLTRKHRTLRSERLRQLVGAGYTPRLVWLFGLMLRGIIYCTDIPQIFNPPIGFGAGAVVAARYAQREWLPVIFVGWYGGDWYWTKVFGLTASGPPTDFGGVPIRIQQVRMKGGPSSSGGGGGASS